MKVRQLCVLAALSLLAWSQGCTAHVQSDTSDPDDGASAVIERAAQDDGEAAARDAGVAADASPGPDDADLADDEEFDACRDVFEEAQRVLRTHCETCHRPRQFQDPRTGVTTHPFFDVYLDPREMIEHGVVLPDDAENSRLYVQMTERRMPPPYVDSRPSFSEVLAVRDWINCGAPLR